jgi:glycosyltransferase involved in cell wall biosynthesis
MNILEVVSTGYPGGGAQISVRTIKEELQRRGHVVSVLSSDQKGDGMFSDRQFRSVPADSRLKAFHHIFYFQSYFALRRAIKEFRPDVIHFHTIAACTPSVLFAIGKTPAVMTIHGPEEFTLELLPWFMEPKDYRTQPFDMDDLTMVGSLRYWYYRFLQRPVYRMGLRRVSLFIAPSKYIAHAVEKDVPPHKIRQVYNGIELPAAKPPAGNQRILYIGRLEKVKGVRYLVRAFAEIAARLPDAELYIVGDGDDRASLEHLAKELGLGDRIIFRGWIKSGPAIEREYEHASVVVIPSIWPENLPTVCIEALASGRAVIGTRTGGIPELIEDGKTGIVVPIKDERALGAAIVRLLEDPPLLASMGASAAESAQRFNAVRFVDQVENIYNHVRHANSHR